MSTTAKELRVMGEKMMAMAESMEAPARELPPKPSQEWLDKHGVELTGEFRAPNSGELTHYVNAMHDTPDENYGTVVASSGWAIQRWILRKRAATPAPVPPPGLLRGDWEHTGELREPRKLADGAYEPWLAVHGEVITEWAPSPNPLQDTMENPIGYTDARRWIVRPKAKAAQPVPTDSDSKRPVVNPWTISQLPVGGVRRWIGQPHNRWTIQQSGMLSDEVLRQWASGAEWCWPHEQFDGVWRPCGEVAK